MKGMYWVLGVFMLLSPSLAEANGDFRAWGKLFNGAVLFSEPPDVFSEDGRYGALSSIDLRFEYQNKFWDVLKLDTAMVGHGDWMNVPEYQSNSGVLGSNNAGAVGRWVDTRQDTSSGNLSAFADLDRLSLGFWIGGAEVIIGRQAISWARTMVFQPLDVIGPFSLLSFDTEAKPGVDALRVRLPILEQATLDIVANPDENSERTTFAMRATFMLETLELGFMLGEIRDETHLGFDGVAAFDVWSLRWESLYLPRNARDNDVVVALGFDRFIDKGDLQIFGELLFDTRGAKDTSELLLAFTNRAYMDGRMKVPVRTSIAFGARYQWSPLWALNASLIGDVSTQSALAYVQASRSLADNLSADILYYQSLGTSWDQSGLLSPGSAFGFFPSMIAVYLRAYH